VQVGPASTTLASQNFEPKAKGRPRPKNCPPGTRPLDRHPDGSKVHPHKPDLGLEPNDWVGIDPDGNIGAADENGDWEELGNVDDYN
jgi:hypothetical protein